MTRSEAKQIAIALGETRPVVTWKIKCISREMGDEFVHTAVRDAMAIEEAGGMMTSNGRRRRTVGGVFFWLVRSRLPEDKREILFPPPHWQRRPSSPVPSGDEAPSGPASEASVAAGSD